MKIIILFGKAGSGKDTLVKELQNRYPSLFHTVVSYTTRPPREGEIEGKDYYFITKEEMANRILNNQMLEVAEFNNWFYGTSLDNFDSEKVNLVVLNPIGIESILNDMGLRLSKAQICIYYISCDDKERLLRQLNREENPNVKEIIRRFSADENDFKNLDFDYITLKNEQLPDFNNNWQAIKNMAEYLGKKD